MHASQIIYLDGLSQCMHKSFVSLFSFVNLPTSAQQPSWHEVLYGAGGGTICSSPGFAGGGGGTIPSRLILFNLFNRILIFLIAPHLQHEIRKCPREQNRLKRLRSLKN